MPGVSEEQVRLAREVDLLTYLQQNEPHELLPPKNGEYRTKTHGSLVISNGQWFWNRGGFGAVSAAFPGSLYSFYSLESFSTTIPQHIVLYVTRPIFQRNHLYHSLVFFVRLR